MNSQASIKLDFDQKDKSLNPQNLFKVSKEKMDLLKKSMFKKFESLIDNESVNLDNCINLLVIKNLSAEILNDEEMWDRIYERYLNKYEKHDPEYRYIEQSELESIFSEYQDCFRWYVDKCYEHFPVTRKTIKSNMLKIISFLNEQEHNFHDYELEHNVYGILDHIINEMSSYFQILTDKEFKKFKNNK